MLNLFALICFILFYPGYPLFQCVSNILPRLLCIPFSLLPLGGGLKLPSFSWPVTLLLIHHMTTPLVKFLVDDITGC